MKKLAIVALAAGTIFGSTSAMAMQAGNAAQAGTSWQAQAPVQLAMKGGHGGGGHYGGGHKGGGHKGGHHGGKRGGHRGKHRGSFHGGFGRSFGWGWGGGWGGGGGGNWWVSVQTPPPVYYHPCYGWYGAPAAWQGRVRHGETFDYELDGPPPGGPDGPPMPYPDEDAPLPPHHDMDGDEMPRGDYDVDAPPMTWGDDTPPPPNVDVRHGRYPGYCGTVTETVTTTTTTTSGCCEQKVVKVYEKPVKHRRRVKAKRVAVPYGEKG